MHLTERVALSESRLHYLFFVLLFAAMPSITGGCDSGGGSGNSDLTAPAAPSGLEAIPRDGEVGLGWNGGSEADSYNLYRSTGSNVEASGDPLQSGISATEFTDTSVENGTTYLYVVTAVVRAGAKTAESNAGGEIEATPFASPTNLEGTSEDSQIQLTWSEATGASAYNIYRDSSSMDNVDEEPLDSGIGKTRYTDTTAENGTKYFYRVTSVNPENQESSASNEVEKTPFSDPPDQP